MTLCDIHINDIIIVVVNVRKLTLLGLREDKVGCRLLIRSSARRWNGVNSGAPMWTTDSVKAAVYHSTSQPSSCPAVASGLQWILDINASIIALLSIEQRRQHRRQQRDVESTVNFDDCMRRHNGVSNEMRPTIALSTAINFYDFLRLYLTESCTDDYYCGNVAFLCLL